MRNWEESNRDTTLGEALERYSRQQEPLRTQHGLLSGVQPWSDSCLNMSVHCVGGCLLTPKQWHSDLSVLHIGHCRSPTCCHTLPRRSNQTQVHQLLQCRTRCGNMETFLFDSSCKIWPATLGCLDHLKAVCLARPVRCVCGQDGTPQPQTSS